MCRKAVQHVDRDARALQLVLEMRRVNQDHLLVRERQLHLLGVGGDLVAGDPVEADLADADARSADRETSGCAPAPRATARGRRPPWGSSPSRCSAGCGTARRAPARTRSAGGSSPRTRRRRCDPSRPRTPARSPRRSRSAPSADSRRWCARPCARDDRCSSWHALIRALDPTHAPCRDAAHRRSGPAVFARLRAPAAC